MTVQALDEPLLPEAVLAQLAAGVHPRPWLWLGAHPMEVAGRPGARFAVWAPAAQRVAVVGSFNGWDGSRHGMHLRPEAGVWELFVPGAARGDFYKYEVTDAQGQVLPLKADPYAFRAELRPGNASIVWGLPERPEALASPLARRGRPAHRRDAPLSIYEVHATSWRRHGDAWPDWDQLARELPPYVAGLGFTHVELMPVSEYPYDPSWGYQTLGLHAPTARLGPPEGLQRFVQACHAAGLGVLLDFVPAHFPDDAHGLARFDGTALYEYADPREGWHPDWHTLIPDFGKPQVQQFLCGAALYWIECFGVEGLRVDAVASMLYRDYSRGDGQWLPNIHGGRENLEAMALLRRLNTLLAREAPGAITIAEESTAFPKVTAPVEEGGLGFHYKWNLGWMNDTLRYMRELPIHRPWHHDKITFGLVYAFNEHFVLPLSHDEVVHEKGALIQKMPADDRGPMTPAEADWQRFANLRAYYGFMWGHPGKKLLFMGQEFAQRSEWDFGQSLPWDVLDDPRHAGVQRLVGDLNRLYREWPALHRQDADAAGFEWLQPDDKACSVFGFVRRAPGQGSVLVACNFTPVPRPGYWMALPAEAAPDRPWRLLLDTDSEGYGGTSWLSSLGPGHGQTPCLDGRGLLLDLPPMATLLFTSAPSDDELPP